MVLDAPGEEVVEPAVVRIKGLGSVVGGTERDAMGYRDGGGRIFDVYRVDVSEGLVPSVESFVVSVRDC